MYTIPVNIPYYPNELLYSWLYRLAKRNGHNNLIEYLKSCVCPYYTNVVQYDVKNIGNLIMDLPHPQEGHFINDYLNTSLYPYTALFLTSEQQTNYLNSVFRTYRKDSKLSNNYNNNTIKHLYFCPQCKSFEIDTYGEFYYHREHQLPGVRICPTHKCQLHRYVGKKGHEFDGDTPSVEVVLKADIETEYKYAVFAKALLEANLDLNYMDVLSLIEKGITKKGYTSLQNYKDSLIHSSYGPLISTRSFKSTAKKSMKTAADSTEIDFTIMLMDIFQTPRNIPHSVTIPTDDLLRTIEEENYVLLSPYRKNIIQLGHIDCQTIFICSGTAITQGWACPFCDLDKTDQEIIKRLISHIDDGSYELLSTFANWNTPIRIIHHKCGQVFETKPRSIIFESRRCLCAYYYTFEMISKNIEGTGEYLLLDFKPSIQNIKVKSIKCNHEFDFNYYKFLKHPHCRVCNPNFIDNKELFLNEMKSLTGDEYELIGDFHAGKKGKKITLLHKTCNQTKEMQAWNFLNGQRCPKCTKQMRLPAFKNFVKEKSMGRYECIDDEMKKDMMVTILDTHTNKTKRMNKNLVRQELTRPTQSDKLPF